MLRDLCGHSSTFIWSDSGVQLGEIRVDSLVQVVSRMADLVPLPDSNPAGCRPVQLTTEAGRTPRHALLISISIQAICT